MMCLASISWIHRPCPRCSAPTSSCANSPVVVSGYLRSRLHAAGLHTEDKACICRFALGALDSHGKLAQPLGGQMAKLPVDPRYGKVLLSAAPLGCVVEAIAVVAMASVDNVFVNPA